MFDTSYPEDWSAPWVLFLLLFLFWDLLKLQDLGLVIKQGVMVFWIIYAVLFKKLDKKLVDSLLIFR